jgi:hypothetical protein
LRAFAAAMAHFWPAGPLPITTSSYSDALNLEIFEPHCHQDWVNHFVQVLVNRDIPTLARLISLQEERAEKHN